MGVMIDAVEDQKLEATLATFFTIEMPILYLISLCAGFTAIWAYIGVIRRFTFEYESLFSRIGAAVFSNSFMIILFGLFCKAIVIDSSIDAIRSFWIISILSVMIIPLFSIRSFDKYLELSRNACGTKGLFIKLALNSNYVWGLLLYAIWLSFATACCLMEKACFYDFLGVVMITFSAYLVLLALIEMFVTWQPKNEKIVYLLSFIGILYFALPFITAGVFDNELLLLFSPLGFVQLFDHNYSMLSILMPVFFNLFYLMLLGLFIGRRYNDLIMMRIDIDFPAKGNSSV